MWALLLLAQPLQEPSLEALLPSSDDRLAAIQAAGETGDARYLPPLIDLLAFATEPEEWYATLDALGVLLTEDLRSVERPWRTLRLRLGGQIAGHPSYPAFKRRLLSETVDPRYDALLAPSEGSELRHELVDWGGVEVDGIPALVDPPVVPGAVAGYLAPEEPVFGLSIDGHARAYPLRILDWHELANDRLGETAFALTYCTLCGSGIAYRTGDSDERDLFRTSGLLLESNKLMYDDRTGSLWSQFRGQPLHGARVDEAPLAVLPLELVPWAVWLERNPQTTVLDLATGFERDYRVGAAYGDYFASPETMFPARGSDRLGPRAKERVLVVRLDQASVVLDATRLVRRGIDRYDLSDPPLLVVSAPRPRPAFPEQWRGIAEDLDAWRELDADALLAALHNQPALAHFMGVDLLLELDDAVRLEVLAAATESDEWTLPAKVRVQAAEYALARDLRVYEAPGRTLRWSSGQLVDEQGAPWIADDEALLGPEGVGYRRVPSHLAFRFAANR